MKVEKVEARARMIPLDAECPQEIDLADVPETLEGRDRPLGFIDVEPLPEVPKKAPVDPSKTSSKLRKLADFIESKPVENFDLRTYIREGDCGTVACVMGWAEILWPNEHGICFSTGIKPSEAEELCLSSSYINPTREAALLRLRSLADKYELAGK